LPFDLDGLGLLSSCHSAPAAFLGSCNSTCLLASQLLSVDFYDSASPDENFALIFVKDVSSDLSVSE